MLKGIPDILSPDLLYAIAQMGHGDELVIGDGNFPAASMNPRCIRCDGQTATAILDAVLQLFPLDVFVDSPVTLMQVAPGTMAGDPPIWADFRRIVDKHQSDVVFNTIDRFEFYERSKKAFATVQTGEKALYACVILKKGIL